MHGRQWPQQGRVLDVSLRHGGGRKVIRSAALHNLVNWEGTKTASVESREAAKPATPTTHPIGRHRELSDDQITSSIRSPRTHISPIELISLLLLISCRKLSDRTKDLIRLHRPRYLTTSARGTWSTMTGSVSEITMRLNTMAITSFAEMSRIPSRDIAGPSRPLRSIHLSPPRVKRACR